MVRSPGTRVVCECWQMNSGPVKEQEAPLSTEGKFSRKRKAVVVY